jgi:hypothetical protein
MKNALRLVLLACAGVASLAFASSALAAFTPRLEVSQAPPRTGAAGVTTFRVTVPRDDEALFRLTIYAPLGYTANAAAAPGTQVGTVSAQGQVQEPIAGAVLPIEGTILAANPASFTTSPCAPGLHAAVWTLNLRAAGQDLDPIPVYVDPASSGEAAFSSMKMVTCLPSPHIPYAAGGARFGAKVLEVTARLRNAFTTPSQSGTFTWRAVATPWAPPATPNIPATVQAIGRIGLPANLTVSASVVSRASRRVRVSGRLTEGGSGVSGQRVRVLVNNRARANVAVRGAGRWSITLRLPRGRHTIRAVAAVGARTSTCSSGAPLPAPCVSQTSSFFTVTSPGIRVRVR